jgi:hypothetical protein
MKQEKIFKFVGDTLMLPGEERQYKADKKIRANKKNRLHKKYFTRKDRINAFILKWYRGD